MAGPRIEVPRPRCCGSQVGHRDVRRPDLHHIVRAQDQRSRNRWTGRRQREHPLNIVMAAFQLWLSMDRLLPVPLRPPSRNRTIALAMVDGFASGLASVSVPAR